MDKQNQRKVEEHLEMLMRDGTPEGIGFCKKFVEYYESKGFNVKDYRIRQHHRENIVCLAYLRSN